MKNSSKNGLAVKNPFAAMSPVERICKISKINLEDFLEIKEKRGITKDSWTAGEIVASFEYLKLRMKELRISKETLKKYGCDFDAYKELYFSVV